MKTTLYIAMFFAMTLGAMSQIFYEVTDPAMPKSKVYILGSIHVADSTFYPLDDKILDAFDDADAIITLIDPNEKERLNAESKKALCYAEDDSLQNHISDSTYRRVKAYFEANQIPLKILNRSTPAFLMIIIEQTETNKAGFNYNARLEVYFSNKAGKKNVIGLETADQQFEIIDMVNYYSDLDVMLCNQLNNSKENISDLHKMVAAWKAHDPEKIDQAIKENTRRFSAAEQKSNDEIFKTRSENFESQIRFALNTEKTYFAIIGSLYLVDESGIIDLLTKSGCKVKRII